MSKRNMAMIDFVYFGGEPLGVPVLRELLARGLRPRAVVTNPDRKSGRGRALTAPPLKTFALQHNLPVLQPESLNDAAFLKAIADTSLYVVVAYNKILPKDFIETPTYGTLNLHPSLLPYYRGPSPIRTAILEDNKAGIGVSVMLLDEKMDHGPLLAQRAFSIDDAAWPRDGEELDQELAAFGGELLAETIPLWITGNITPQPQDHTKATYTKKLTKAQGELELNPYELPHGEAAQALLRRIRGLAGWPGTFFFYQGVRYKILAAHIEDDTLIIDTVLKEGKKPAPFTNYFE